MGHTDTSLSGRYLSSHLLRFEKYRSVDVYGRLFTIQSHRRRNLFYRHCLGMNALDRGHLFYRQSHWTNSWVAALF